MGGDELILNTGIDTSGFKRDSQKLLQAVSSFGNTVNRQSKAMIKSVKGLGRSLVAQVAGAATLFGALSKATSAYLSQNQILSNKLNAMWTALGNALAPIINAIAEAVLKAVSMFLEFLRVIGIVDKTASQLSRGIGQLQKSVLGFDELNKLSTNTGQGTLDDYSLPEWLQNIADLIKQGAWEEVAALVAKKLSELIIKGLNAITTAIENFDWAKLARTIESFLRNIDWKGIRDAFIDLFAAAINAAFEMIGEFLDLSPEDIEKITGAVDSLKEKIKELCDFLVDKFGEFWTNTLKPLLQDFVTDVLPEILDLLGDICDLIDGKMDLKEFGGQLSDIQQKIIGIITLVGAGKVVKWATGVADSIAKIGTSSQGSTTLVGALIKKLMGSGSVTEAASAAGASTEAAIGEATTALGVGTSALATFGGAAAGVGTIMAIAAADTAIQAQNFYDLNANASESEGIISNLAIELNDLAEQQTHVNDYGYEYISEVSKEMNYRNEALIKQYEEYCEQCKESGEQVQSLTEIIEAHGQTIDGVSQEVINSCDALRDEYSGVASEVVSSSQELSVGISQNMGEAEQSVSQFSNYTNSTFSIMNNKWLSWGRDMVVSLSQGISERFPILSNTMSTLSNSIRSFIHFSEPDEGPLSDFHTYMPDMIKMMVDGIEDGEADVSDAAAGLSNGISSAIQDGNYDIGDITADFDTNFSDFADKIVNGFSEMILRLEELMSGFNFVTPEFATGSVTPYSVGTSDSSNGADTLFQIVSDIRDAISGMNTDSTNNISFKVELDGKELATTVTKLQKRDARAKGY